MSREEDLLLLLLRSLHLTFAAIIQCRSLWLLTLHHQRFAAGESREFTKFVKLAGTHHLQTLSCVNYGCLQFAGKTRDKPGHPTKILKQKTYIVVSCVHRSFCVLEGIFLYRLICSMLELEIEVAESLRGRGEI